MAKGPTYVVQFRRRRQKKTDYKRRLNLLKSGKLRLVVRPSNKHTIVQLIRYEMEGDRVLVSAHSKELAGLGWKHATGNIPSSYLTGLLCGIKSVKQGIDGAVLDLGLLAYVKGGRIFAALKGVVDAGVSVPADEVVFPPDERLTGEHIAGHVKRSANINKDFESVKAKILKTKNGKKG